MTNFILGFHCHQPVGNFDSVFREIHEKSYSPLIRTLAASRVKFCFHASGVLLEWWEENDPGFLEIIASGAAEGNIELVGGGYYEPILAMIPKKDRIRQLTMLNEAYLRFFGRYPSGAWITERIWQPDIIEDLNEAGLNYAFLDDFQFFQSGAGKDDIDCIFRTEYNGLYLDVFPIHERLRYKLPFANPDESLNEILYLNGRYSKISVMFDDGEKMGGWPDTYEWVYGKEGQKGWLENFIKAANTESRYSDIKFSLPSEVLAGDDARKPAYLPISSYREMGEWTLSIEKRGYYEALKAGNPDAPLCGGIWHGFLTRYPEANLLHKRMCDLSLKMDRALKTRRNRPIEATKELLKSQANDAYWHGVFGGIYLPHLRRAVHKAHALSYRLYKDAVKACLEKEYTDMDMDGEKEVLLSNDYWLAIYKPSTGSFIALDYIEKGLIHSIGDVFCLHNEYDVLKLKEDCFKKSAVNGKGFLNSGGKYGENPPETIHHKVRCPENLCERDLTVFAGLLPAFEVLFNGNRVYFKDESISEGGDGKSLVVETEGFLNKNGEQDGDANLAPLLRLGATIGKTLEFAVDYDGPASAAAGMLEVIFRFSFPGGDGPATNIKIGEDVSGLNNDIKKDMDARETCTIYLSDSFWGGRISLNHAALSGQVKRYGIISAPVTTISLSESGFERIFQGIEIRYVFNLTTEEVFRSIISMNIEKIAQ